MIDAACVSHCVTYVTVTGKDTTWGVITSIPHITGELVYGAFEEIFTGLILYPLGKRWLRRHDKKEHN